MYKKKQSFKLKDYRKIKSKITKIEIVDDDKLEIHFEGGHKHTFNKDAHGLFNRLVNIKEGDEVVLIIKYSKIIAVEFF